MFSEAQIHYLEDVLGVSPNYFRGEPLPTVNVGIVVWTATLNDAEKALLAKILASVSLKDFTHLEGETARPEGAHVIHFVGGEGLGRLTIDGAVHWRLPAIAEMLGAGAGVVEKKKMAWNLLQQFAREKNQ
jgi:hypothetical protein